MGNINWSKYKSQILELSGRGLSSSEILENLKQSSSEKFYASADRTIRKIVKKNKELIQSIPKNVDLSSKILIFDIETYPMLAYTFNKWKANINDDFIIHDWGVLSWAAKWLFDDEVISDRLTENELKNRDDRRIMQNLWHLIDKAEIIIAHNAKKFDIKRMNTRYLKYGLNPPSPYQVIDTLLHVRKRFSITSNRLDYIAKKFFGIEGKMQTESGLWMRCMNNDYQALIYMDDYCKQDVRVLEDVYLKIRGWISPHPNLALLATDINGNCPVCLSDEKELTETNYNTYVNSYTAYRCKGCGHIYRERKTLTPLKNNFNLKVSTPN